MDKRALHRLRAVEETTQKDAEFMYLYSGYQQTESRLLSLLRELPQEQRELILDYIYQAGQISLRMMELACFEE